MPNCERCQKPARQRRTRCTGCARLCCGRCGTHYRPLGQARGGPCALECWDCQTKRETTKEKTNRAV